MKFKDIFKKKKEENTIKNTPGSDEASALPEVKKETYDERLRNAMKSISNPLVRDYIEKLNQSDIMVIVDYEDGHYKITHDYVDFKDSASYYKKKMLDFFVLSAQTVDGRNKLLDNPVRQNWEIANRLIRQLSKSTNYDFTFDEFKYLLTVPSILTDEEINNFLNVERIEIDCNPEDFDDFDDEEL